MIEQKVRYPATDHGELSITATDTFLPIEGGGNVYFRSSVFIKALRKNSAGNTEIPSTLLRQLQSLLSANPHVFMLSTFLDSISFHVDQRQHVEPIIEDIKREIMLEKLSRE